MAAATLTVTAEPGSHNVTMVRDFAATPEQLLRAHTDPELFARWIGCGDFEVTDMEPRAGGRWRYAADLGPNGFVAFHGRFHADPTPEDGLVQTFEYESYPGQVGLETTTFEPLGDGRTRLVLVSVYPSVEARDAAVASGMEHGMRESYVVLDGLLSGGDV